MTTLLTAGAVEADGRTRRMLIGGRWTSALSGASCPVIDPATGCEFALVPLGDAEDIDRAVAAARHAFDEDSWRLTTVSDRGRFLLRLADLIEEHAEELAQAEALDSGKPLSVVQSSDILLAVDVLRRVAGWAGLDEDRRWTVPVALPGTTAYPVLVPSGVVGVVTPWAFPLLMAVWQLAPALAAGSAVVLRPAEQTPLSALLLGWLAQEAGLPEGVLNIVTGRAGAALRLVAHPGVDRVVFTGCAEVGSQLARAACADPRKVALRIGGRAPLVIYRDCDIEQAVAQAATAGFFSHFQTCTTGAVLYAEKEVYGDVVAGVTEQAAMLRVGPALDPASQLGPVVSAGHFRRTSDYLTASLAAGAVTRTGGRRLGDAGYFLEPTVLTGCSRQVSLAAAGITGPVLPVLAFSDPREIASSSPGGGSHGCAAGVWTKDVSKAHRTAAIVHASTVWVNTYRVYDTALPFGEPRHAGWGPEILDEYRDSRSVIIRTSG